jgi:phospholipase/lecithinase/hemolysin
MYAMLDSGLPVWWVNQALELLGRQRDGLVLSEAEAQQIMTRIDGFNAALRSLARAAGPNVHVVEIGPLLSQVLTGRIPLTIGGHRITRKWIRGSSFGFDGVHPGYTGQALIADALVADMNAVLGLNAPLESLAAVIATDPYVDRDGDGWAAGPRYEHDGITQLLFLLKDPDDSNADAQVDLPDDVWDQIREALLGELLQSVPQLRPEAERLGLTPAR